MIYPLLFTYTVLLSIYDFRHKRIPNWATIPVILAGSIAAFPGTAEQWFTVAVLIGLWFMGGQSGILGGGDTKLWISLIFATPNMMPLTMMLSLLVAFLLHWTYLAIKKESILGVSRPLAWLATIFSGVSWVMAWYVH